MIFGPFQHMSTIMFDCGFGFTTKHMDNKKLEYQGINPITLLIWINPLCWCVAWVSPNPHFRDGALTTSLCFMLSILSGLKGDGGWFLRWIIGGSLRCHQTCVFNWVTHPRKWGVFHRFSIGFLDSGFDYWMVYHSCHAEALLLAMGYGPPSQIYPGIDHGTSSGILCRPAHFIARHYSTHKPTAFITVRSLIAALAHMRSAKYDQKRSWLFIIHRHTICMDCMSSVSAQTCIMTSWMKVVGRETCKIDQNCRLPSSSWKNWNPVDGSCKKSWTMVHTWYVTTNNVILNSMVIRTSKRKQHEATKNPRNILSPFPATSFLSKAGAWRHLWGFSLDTRVPTSKTELCRAQSN